MKAIKEKPLGRLTLTALRYALIALVWIGIWLLLAFLAKREGNELIFPSPVDVLGRFFEFCGTAEFYKTVFYSLLRVLIGNIAAILLGVVLAILTSRFGFFGDFIRPMMTVIKSTPVASFIILALVLMSRSLLPVFIVFLIVLPVVWANVHEGITSTDKKLKEVATVFGISFGKCLSSLYIPTVAPYFRSALLSSVGLAWKAGIAAEVLAAPSASIGKKLFESKQYLETVDLFAWTLAVIIMSLLVESAALAISGLFTKGKRTPQKDSKARRSRNA